MSKVTAPFQPFELSDETAYRCWREWKLRDYPAAAADLVVPVKHIGRLDASEQRAIKTHCGKTNVAIYDVVGDETADRRGIRAFGKQFGLERLDTNLRADEDSITSLRVVAGTAGTQYIPYTNRPLNWHTDGYYNTPAEQVRAIVMHCATAAASGGDNLLLDPEIVYLLLRDENPDYITALMQADAMTIPANIEAGIEIRPAQSGPVFAIENSTGDLHMRYTARTRSIEWKDERNTRLAVGFLSELLASDSAWIFRHRLRAGQGIICNNVLHKREAFADDAAAGQTRLLYRARYHERIRGTELCNRFNGVSECSG